MKILVANPGHPPDVRHEARALYEDGLLHHFATTYVDHPDDPLSSTIKGVVEAVSPSYVSELERRSFTEIPYRKLRTYPTWEILRTIADRFLDNRFLADRLWEVSQHRFDKWVAQQVSSEIGAVYTNPHSSLSTLRRARELDVPILYRQPSQHHAFFERIYDEQMDQYPEITGNGARLHEGHLAAQRDVRRDAELALADYVVTASSFTKRTLVEAGVDAEKILVTPYGCPEVDPKPQSVPEQVVFLNAGTQNLRKGLHLLYRAWEDLAPSPDAAALHLIGRMMLPEPLRRGLPGDVRCDSSIPHTELMRRYKNASVFVLPSLADGFGMVITEAMSRGLPVITTDNTGAADLVTHGENGFVVPAGDVDALRDRLHWCVDHRDRLPAMGAAAAETARSWQWSDYRDAFAASVRDAVASAQARSQPSTSQ